MAINITQNVEDITKQVLDINRKYINKSVDIIGKLKNGAAAEKITNIDQDLIADVFAGIVKLNIDYYSKLMDYSFSITDRILSPQTTEEEVGSSFTLSGKGNPGATIEMGFVLDNSKEEKVFCELQSTRFINADDETENPEISVSFQPQSFELEAGGAANIGVICNISKEAATGTFHSFVKVLGFEPAYFTIVITIEKNTMPNASNTEPIETPATKQ